ncbi:UDP-N-acetylmuramoyl-tripeptide--D-alanyl-D-alanine ligase [Spiribacter sp. 221]|uniref:UDP-N-acetylmuramoyl-tripeptide--D-alanyl-D- alanine ligase n=1 Tax=Spiribacter onubensis TaxID=3122420 RepID=UPI00349FA357
MRAVRLKSLAVEFSGTVRGSDVTVTGVALDSRRLQPRDLFVALPGSQADGHEFLEAAAAAGATAAMVTRFVDVALPQWRVADPRRVLIELACRARSESTARMVGVTGSNGKTTVKEMLTAILARMGATRATEGNLNNELGVPLTLCRIEPADRYAVVEMGCGKPGDIGLLASWARPGVGLVTNAGPAHLGSFGTIEAVARCKGELFQALPDSGYAIINADDPHASLWEQKASHCHIERFSLDGNPAEVSGEILPDDRLRIRFADGELVVSVPLPGRHNRLNALAAATAARAAGADFEAIATGLAEVAPVTGRLQGLAGPNGSRIIDDSYNANPASLAAAMETLTAEPGPVWLALGDMAELGDKARPLHAEAGDRARALGVSRVFATGELSAHTVEAFGAGGEWFEDQAALIEALVTDLTPGVRVLVKGSRSAAMDRVVAALREAAARETSTCC